MYDQSELFELLKSGKSASDIANEFTKNLNAAMKQQNDEEEAAKRKKAQEEQKVDELSLILDDLYAWLLNYYEVEITEEDFSAEDFISLLDMGNDLSKSLSINLTKKNNNKPEVRAEKTENGYADSLSRSVDEIFDAFFKRHGL